MRSKLLTLPRYTKIAEKMVIEEERLKYTLSQLFNHHYIRRQLSLKFKILPNYFDTSYIQLFCSGKNYPAYLKYVNQEKDFIDQEQILRKAFKQVNIGKILCNNYYIRYLQSFLNWLLQQCQQFSVHENDYVFEQLNIDRPDKWFQIKNYCTKRQFIYHHGPTNSGKSTAAIQELKLLTPLQKGIYMAPLRLLAWEYQQKLGNCTLITGQEKEFKNSNLVSCTIQAAPLNDEYEVAVIDEIQMIGDVQRGWAWTRAVLATKAKRIHLCGDQRALNIISKLVEITQDTLQERTYSRLSKLSLIHKIFNIQSISPGDCIVDFSMNKLLRHRSQLNKMFMRRKQEQEAQNLSQQQKRETSIDRKIVAYNKEEKKNFTAIVYGRLPPQCKRQQALFFNNEELPYLVATNAIGMGLNLKIKKVIFMSIERVFSDGPKLLQEHEIQQIAGRAGRGTETGYVQCATPFILRIVKKALLNVNQTYNIQLQNINDGQIINEQYKQQRSIIASQVYCQFLKRPLKQKECAIKYARLYFTIDYIILIKYILQSTIKKEFNYIELIDYLRNNCILNDLYIFQSKEEIDYLIQLLENNKYDIEEINVFLIGLSLSQPANNTPQHIKALIIKTHQDYVNNFINLRKVSLPQFLLQHHHQNYNNYQYISQISELQYFFNLLETYVWLWNKFQFAFYQIKLAKEIKISLANKINAILQDNKYEQKDLRYFQRQENNEKKRQKRLVRKQNKELYKDKNRSQYQHVQKSSNTFVPQMNDKKPQIIIKNRDNDNSFFKKSKKVQK